jgi:two-component system OmpR family response regulator
MLARDTGGVTPEPSQSDASASAGRPTRADGSALRVLVVDDELLLAEAVAQAFAADGWETRILTRGREVAFVARDFVPDIVVLDIMLPDLDGLEVLERIRAAREETRVLFLTAKDAQEDRIAGLQAGGDDYLTKPFSVLELVARGRALARTSLSVADGGRGRILPVGDLEIDVDAREVFRGTTAVDLTSTEFELLNFLARNQRRVVSKSEILTAVWGYDFGADSNLVEMYVSYLRRKLGEPGDPVIHTVRSAGYILKPASREETP